MALSWALFGVLTAVATAVVGALFQQSARIEALGGRLDSRIDATNARLDATNSRLDATNVRLDAVMGAVQDLGRRFTERGL